MMGRRALLALVLAAGALGGGVAVVRTDRAMRSSLLKDARSAAQSVDMEHVRALTGTEADLDSPDYRRLKEHLAAVRSASARCRFVYLLRRQPALPGEAGITGAAPAGGTIFFLLDSESPDSKDNSPPGQIYEEVSDEYRRVFDTGVAAVEGPVTDRWGMWVSALVPLADPQRGELTAVLGMDVDARHWRRDLLAAAALPALTTAAALALLAVSIALAESRRHLAGQAARLLESERNFHSLFESSADLVWVAKPEGRIVHANEAARRQLGYAPEDLLSLRVTDLYPEGCRAEAESILAAVLRGERDSCPLPLAARDGTLVPVETRVWRGRWDSADCMVGLARVLSPAQEAREVIEATFRRNPSPMALSSLPDRRYVEVNDAFLAVTGYARDEVLGRTPVDLGLSVAPALLKAVADRLIVEGRIANQELTLRRKDGALRDGLFWGEVIASQGRHYFLTIMLDITERKQAEAERARLEAAIEQAGEVVVITDPGGTIEYVNPAFTIVTGYTRDEALGQNPRILKSGQHDDAFYRDLWAALEAGRVWKGRFVNRRQDGVLYTEDATISPVLDAAGRTVHYVAVKRDISEELRLSAQFQEAQKMESIGRLAGGVAHDFNNMLQVILGTAEQALERLAPSDPLRTELELMHRVGSRSADLTRQLLAFARQQTIVPRVLDLNDTVAGMAAMLRRLIGEDIDLVWRPGESLWPVKVDPAQIDQVLANLCVNARDAIAGSGRIVIETDSTAFDETDGDRPPDLAAGEYVRLAVTDDGCGMDEGTLAHLFEPFFTTKGTGLGTGLGLATVYGIVKQNRGHVTARSELGKGTTFEIYLPRHVESTPATPEATPAWAVCSGDETILVAEDEMQVLAVVRRCLEGRGYTVLAAETPEAALRQAEAHPGEIHLLVSDMVMPGLSGIELRDRLVAARPRMRSLFITGYTTLALGGADSSPHRLRVLAKPFSLRDLAVAVRETLDAGAA